MRALTPWVGIGLLSFTVLGQAAPAVRYDAEKHIFRIDGEATSYVLGVNERGQLQSLYWGGRLGPNDPVPPAVSGQGWASFDIPQATAPQEFPGWGGGLFVEPALKVSFPDGNRDLVLRYVSHQIQDAGLTVRLRDISRDIQVELRYTIDPQTGILGRSAVIENHTRAPLTIQQAAAAAWTLPAADDYSLRYLTGRWAGEWQLRTAPILPGQIVLESRRGSTGHQNNPWFAIERGGAWNEDSGGVWFGALAWSGSWRITVEQDQLHHLRITGGFNPFDFSYPLRPGESLQTPVFYAGYAAHGSGEASRLLHRFELAHILPQAPRPRVRPVLYNSWEATEFDVNEAGQEKLAELAAGIGIERFVMDDGWFGARNNDKAGLGDWVVNPHKFPHGLGPLIAKVRSLGMDFGLWVEPEMVNPDSDLYRKHPDWVLNFPGRPRSEARNQLVLNLARTDVRDHVFQVLDALVSNNEIHFLKWDYNRNWSEPGWPEQPATEQQKVYVAYVRNLYWILQQLRQRHPGLEIESCSGGGGRVDLGILGLTDQVWPSDNTDPFDRLTIQDGFTRAYTPGVMMAWVTDSPNWLNKRSTSLEYRFISSMQGSLGIGANLTHWTAEDFVTAKRLIAEYKTIRETVQHGALYRLQTGEPAVGQGNAPVAAQAGEYYATESVATDQAQAVAFAYLHSSSLGYPFPRLTLKGLEPQAIYHRRVIAGAVAPDTPEAASGAYWMSRGIDLTLRGDFQAAAVVFERDGAAGPAH